MTSLSCPGQPLEREDVPVAGGGFLLRESRPEEIFTPEDFTSEQRMFAKTARDFVQNEVLPRTNDFEASDKEAGFELLRRAGELGFLMAEVPEKYGGLGLDKTSAALVVESLAGQMSFIKVLCLHVSLGMLPIIYYGTTAQREKWLPGLGDGSVISCYGLTEPTAGSDALSGRARAELSADGKYYILNATKQFITNSRYADIMTVFAKVHGDRFTAFLVEKGTPGISYGPDEKKMGLRGLSSSRLMLDDVKIPVENVLGEVGKGHKVAFNILNMARFKFGAIAVGSMKRAIEQSLAYCLERKQFGRPIADFGAIREKLAQMYIRMYATESMTYRTVGMIERLRAAGVDVQDEMELRSAEEYSVECSMVKIVGSEAQGFVADEMVQCYGGYGYCAEYPADAFYRDVRLTRIIEGTNEINRILIPTMLLRKVANGKLDLLGAAREVKETLVSGARAPDETRGGLLERERGRVEDLKRVALLMFGVASEKCGENLSQRQTVQLRLANLVMAAYEAESTVLRAMKDVGRRGEDGAALAIDTARVVCQEALDRAEGQSRQALAALVCGEELDGLLAGVQLLLRRTPADTLGMGERIAAKLLQMERFVT